MTFDGPNKIIDVPSTLSVVDVKHDLYSAWKDWVVAGNAQYLHAFEVSGGDDIGGGKFSPSYFFLVNGWKVRMPVASGVVYVSFNLFSRDGSSPYITGSTRKQVVSETTSGSTVNISGGGGGATPAEIWSYIDRTLTSGGSGGGLTPEEHDALMNRGSGGGIVDFTKKNEEVLKEFKEFKKLLQENKGEPIDYAKIKEIIEKFETSIDISPLQKGIEGNISKNLAEFRKIHEKDIETLQSEMQKRLEEKEKELEEMKKIVTTKDKALEEKEEEIEELEEQIEKFSDLAEVLDEENEDMKTFISDTE